MSKNKVKSNSNIKCDVVSCENNNLEEGTCTLKEVSISCDCDNDKCHDTCETICQSFKETSANINDNEYEVDSDSE
jgi:hypothetical protein